MKTNYRLFLGTVLVTLSGLASAALPDSIDGQPFPSLAPLVERVSPAVVNIRVSQTVTRRGSIGDEAFRRFFGIPDSGRPQEVTKR